MVVAPASSILVLLNQFTHTFSQSDTFTQHNVKMSRILSFSSPEGNMEGKDLWSEVFPFEITIFRAIASNANIVRFANWFFIISTLAVLADVAFLVVTGVYITSDDPISLVVLLNAQGILVLMLPYVCFHFVAIQMSNPDLNDLISTALGIDSRLKLKFGIITHINFLCLIWAVLFYIFQGHLERAPVILLLGVFYLGPLNSAVSLGVCVVELHRIRIEHFRDEINQMRERLERHDSNRSDANTAEKDSIGEGKRKFSSVVEMNTRSSYCQDRDEASSSRSSPTSATDTNIKALRNTYYHIHAICRRSSRSFGWYLLFFVIFGFLYTIATIYGIYLGQYPTQGIAGFVFVGLFIALGLGAVLTASNESG